jgi:Protein of unknown function (DUF2971)
MSFVRGSRARRREFPPPRISTPPQILFKYQKIDKYSLQNLETRSIYFNAPSHFNDLFDCTISARFLEPTAEVLEAMRETYIHESKDYPLASSQFAEYSLEQLKEFLFRGAANSFEREREDFLNNNGVSCFSEVHDDLLMWGHYGDSYKGFCLEYRTGYDPLTRLRKVKYEERIPKIDLAPFVVEADAEQLLDLYCTKSRAWEYEREWRAIHWHAGTSYYQGNPWAIRAVYLGPRISDEDRERVRLALSAANPTAECWQGRKSEEEFKIEFERLA